MPTVRFTQNIQRHITCPTERVIGQTVRQALEAVFQGNPVARSYVLDDQGELRKHMIIFIDGEAATDRAALSDPVGEESEIHVFQALSGG